VTATLLGGEFPAGAIDIVRASFLVIWAPLLVGMAAPGRHSARGQRLGNIAAFLSNALMLAAVVSSFILGNPLALMENKNVVLALAMFLVAGLCAGHRLGGRESRGRITLAFDAAVRHPGLAVALVAPFFPGEDLISTALGLYLAASLIAVVIGKRISAATRERAGAEQEIIAETIAYANRHTGIRAPIAGSASVSAANSRGSSHPVAGAPHIGVARAALPEKEVAL
jgi:predicted Na+-dependent transporter